MRPRNTWFDEGAANLPYVDEIWDGESGHGYALRMACGNGLNGLGRVKQLLGRTHAFAVLTSDDAASLAQWFGASVQRLALALEQLPNGRREHGVVLAGQLFGRKYFLNRCYPRICPDCLSEFGYCRLAWEFSLVVACARHRRLLVDRCPACHCAIRWSRPGLDVCHCGTPWQMLDAPEAPSRGELVLAHLVDQKVDDVDRFGNVEIDNQDGADAAGRMLPALLSKLTLDGVFRIVYALATAAAYDLDMQAERRERGMLRKARQTIDMACSFGLKVSQLQKISLRSHRPTVLLDLLGESYLSESSAQVDRSLAISMLRWLLASSSPGPARARHASLAQGVLF